MGAGRGVGYISSRWGYCEGYCDEEEQDEDYVDNSEEDDDEDHEDPLLSRVSKLERDLSEIKDMLKVLTSSLKSTRYGSNSVPRGCYY
jgi:hypothetical protein